MQTIHLYLRASTKEQDSQRALDTLEHFATNYHPEAKQTKYLESFTGTKIERPELSRLLENSKEGDILLVESVDRLTRLTSSDFMKLKLKIAEKGLHLVIYDLPTTHRKTTDTFQQAINSLLIDLLASMARLDQEKRIERIKQGLERSGYKPTGKSKNKAKHQKINELLEKNDKLATKDKITLIDIAKLANVGVATVYRAKSEKEKAAI